MHFAAVLNRDGGLLRSIDVEALAERMVDQLRQSGHTIEVEIVRGNDVDPALQRAASKAGVDVVIAGGGDGTISTAAGCLMGAGPALAVLPVGTMNLFARGLGVPLDLEQAIAGFADGRIRAVDMARVNGKPFVHQYSAGMHARMIRLRNEMSYRSRLGKLRASLLALYATITNPPFMEVSLDLDGKKVICRASAVGVSNNRFGEGHLPYADDPAGGELGVYVMVAREKADVLRLALGLLRGKWRQNPHIENYAAQKAILSVRPLRRRVDVALDGELIPFEPQATLEIVPASLRVLIGC